MKFDHPGSYTVTNPALPRGTTPYGSECAAKLRQLLGPAPKTGWRFHDAIDPRVPGADEEEEDDAKNI